MVTETQMYLMIAWVIILAAVYVVLWYLHERQMSKYPDHIREVLKAKYRSISRERKNIRKIRRRSNKLNIFGINHFKLFGRWFFDLSVDDYKAFKKRHYILNKRLREIEGIKEHYGKVS